MKEKAKPIKRSVNKYEQEQKQKSQNRFFLVMSFIFLLALLVSFMVPVYYVPLFKNISSRYGLSADITRKLTLLDLALNSLGIETPNMAAAFKKHNVEYEPDVFYTSRFSETGANSRLINAKETYYHEYERTKKRPAEIAGIYQDKTAVNTPEIDGDLKGIRALPKDDYFDDDSFTDFSYKESTVTTVNNDEVMGSKRRQVRGSFDRQEQGQTDSSNKHEPLPDFTSSIYNSGEKGETQTLENSRMIKPVVSGEQFSVVKPENIISKLVGDSSFTDTFASLTNFGGYNGALGYYVKDDLPKKGFIDFFGNTGQDLFSAYFYSYEAVGRKYLESSKHLAEIAFHGEEPKDKILVARGQKEANVPTINTTDMSPLELVLAVKHNLKECREASERYKQEVAPLKTAYENAKNTIIGISKGTVTAGVYPNYAWRGAPGSCECGNYCRPTMQLRDLWNKNVEIARNNCIAIREKERAYAEACKMDYITDPIKDTCEAIDALEVEGGEGWFNLNYLVTGMRVCRVYVKWKNQGTAHSFQKCGSEEGLDTCEYWKVFFEVHGGTTSCNSVTQQESRANCVEEIGNLFEEIDTNIKLETQPGFVFN